MLMGERQPSPSQGTFISPGDDSFMILLRKSMEGAFTKSTVF